MAAVALGEDPAAGCGGRAGQRTSHNPLLTLDRVVENPQMDARGYFLEIEHPVAGKFRYPGAPIYTNDDWWVIRRPAPMLGQHNTEVLRDELGYSDEAVSRMTGVEGSAGTTSGASGAPSSAGRSTAAPSTKSGNGKKKLPLEGVRITDMTVIYAGPYATMFLGDMGAEVIASSPSTSFLPPAAASSPDQAKSPRQRRPPRHTRTVTRASVPGTVLEASPSTLATSMESAWT